MASSLSAFDPNSGEAMIDWLLKFESRIKLAKVEDEEVTLTLLKRLLPIKVQNDVNSLRLLEFTYSKMKYADWLTTLKVLENADSKQIIERRNRLCVTPQMSSQSLADFIGHLRSMAEKCAFPNSADPEKLFLPVIFMKRIYDERIKWILDLDALKYSSDMEYLFIVAQHLEKSFQDLDDALNCEDSPQEHCFSGPWTATDQTQCAATQHLEHLSLDTSVKAPEQMMEMDDFYPNWWNQDSTETVCIPACLDVVKSAFLGPTDPEAANFNEDLFNENARHYRGQKAEEAFLRAFQKLHLGGVFISGFKSREYATKINKGKAFKKFGITEVECDSIFIHPRLGIFVIEIKAIEKTKAHSNIFDSEQYQKAMSQLKIYSEQIPKIFQKICNTKECTIPIYVAACFPFSFLKNKKQSSFIHIDQSHFIDIKTLKKVFTNRLNFVPENPEQLEQLKKFACAISSYRSIEFLSAGRNALAVHKIIDIQSFGSGSSAQIGKSEIFWTNEQLAILECNDRHQIIYGSPGTGKTLILLQKALKAAQSVKDGSKIYVMAVEKNLVLRFKQFFEKCKDSIVRHPNIIELRSDVVPRQRRNDEIFIDEFPCMASFIGDFVRHYDHVMVVLNGYAIPTQIHTMDSFRKIEALKRLRYFEMNTVIRSSKKNYNEWKSEFLNCGIPIRIGHNCKGPTVVRVTAFNSDQILNNIFEIISKLKKQVGDDLFSNLAIITEITSANGITDFLKSKSVPCGSVSEQMELGNRVAISQMLATVSLEWPFVIITSFFSLEMHQSLFLLAASRCMSQMYVIERDYMSIQAVIEEKFYELRRLKKHIDVDTFKEIVVNTGKEFGETHDVAIAIDAAYARIRLNFVSDDMELLSPSIEDFKGCTTLFECFAAAAQSSALRSLFLNIYEDPDDRAFYKSTCQITSQSNSPTKLFNQICSNRNESDREQLWRTFSELNLRLISTVNEEKAGNAPAISIMFHDNKMKKIATDIIARIMNCVNLLQTSCDGDMLAGGLGQFIDPFSDSQ